MKGREERRESREERKEKERSERRKRKVKRKREEKGARLAVFCTEIFVYTDLGQSQQNEEVQRLKWKDLIFTSDNSLQTHSDQSQVVQM